MMNYLIERIRRCFIFLSYGLFWSFSFLYSNIQIPYLQIISSEVNKELNIPYKQALISSCQEINKEALEEKVEPEIVNYQWAQEEVEEVIQLNQINLRGLPLALITPVHSTVVFPSPVPISEHLAYLPMSHDLEGKAKEIPDTSDAYIEGYVQAMIDDQFHGTKVRVVVREHRVYLSDLPANRAIAKSIISMTEKMPGVKSVKGRVTSEAVQEIQESYAPKKPKIKGVWFPQNTVLFPPLIADPRAVVASLGYRWQWKQGSEYEGHQATIVSYGDEFPIYRWVNLGKIKAEVQIGIEGGAWAVFRMDKLKGNHWAELVNTDYFLGIPLSWALDKWSFRFRLYHISTHLGDEFIESHPDFPRFNPSYEAIDLFTAWQITENLRLYVGLGRIMHDDNDFHLQPLYFEYGTELRFFNRIVNYNRLYGQFFVATNFKNQEARHWATNATYVLGYEWSKLRGAGRKCRIFGEYHAGFSADGQFYFERLSYASLRFSYGF